MSSSSSPEVQNNNGDGRKNMKKDFHRKRNASSSASAAGKGKTANYPDLRHDGKRRSAFTPYRPSTILTNLQRGNIQTETQAIPVQELTVHQLAAQGELMPEDRASWNTDEADENGLTPLMWACSYGQLPVVSMLLQWGMDPCKVGNHGQNALLLASANGHSDIIKALLEKGMDVNHADDKGNTALIYSAYNNHALCTYELLKNGADLTMENINGQTAFSIAVDNGSKQAQIVMEKHMIELIRPAPAPRPASSTGIEN